MNCMLLNRYLTRGGKKLEQLWSWSPANLQRLGFTPIKGLTHFGHTDHHLLMWIIYIVFKVNCFPSFRLLYVFGSICVLYFHIHHYSVDRQGPFPDLITCPQWIEECINFPRNRPPMGSKCSPGSCQGKGDKGSEERTKQFSLNVLTCGY